MTEEQPGYSERDQEPTTEQTGGDPEVLEEHEHEHEQQQDGTPADDAAPSGEGS